jgi:putative transposase
MQPVAMQAGRRKRDRVRDTRKSASATIVYLFVDGIAEGLRPGQRREAVLAAWGFGEDGREVLLGLMEGSKEDVEAVRAFGDSLLVVSDGVSGIIRAIADCFPRSAGQRCLAHRIATSPPRVPTDL